MVPLHNFVVKPVTSCMHVHSMEGCISGKRQAFIKKCIGCYLFQCPIFFFKQDIPRWGEETRFGTEKRWSHNLQSKYFQTFQKQEANRQRKSEMLKKLKKIISCIFVFLAYRICLSVLKLRGKLKRNRLRSQPTTTRSIDLFIGYIVFAGQG